MDLTVGAGWYYLGPAATNSGNQPGVGIVVRELEPGALADIADWVQVWNDAGSGAETDFSLWRGVAPSPEYVVVGGFFLRSHDKPSASDTKGMKAVRKEYLVTAAPGKQIWTDGGSGARQDGAVWSVSTTGNVDALDTGAFVPVGAYNSPPSPVFAFDRSKVIDAE